MKRRLISLLLCAIMVFQSVLYIVYRITYSNFIHVLYKLEISVTEKTLTCDIQLYIL